MVTSFVTVLNMSQCYIRDMTTVSLQDLRRQHNNL